MTYARPGLNIPTDPVGSQIDPAILKQLLVWGYTAGVRIDLQSCDGPTLSVRSAEIVEAGLEVAPILNTPEAIQWMPGGAVLLGPNEPDLQMSVRAYRPLAQAMAEEAVRLGRMIWLGSISNLDRNSLRFLREVWNPAWTQPPYQGLIHCEYHRYPDGDPPNPMAGHDGMTPDEELVELRDIVGAVDLVCGEVGYEDRRLTEEQVMHCFRIERERATRHKVSRVYAYNINDGLTDNAIDNYGFRTVQGLWKARAEHYAEAL